MESQEGLLQVPQEVLEEAGDGVDIIYLAEHRNSFTAEELLFQLLHCAISAGQTVQTSLKEKNKQTNIIIL